jgi:hypothetical protein
MASEKAERATRRTGRTGLMKIRIPPPAITPNKEVISRQSVGAGATVTLKPSTTYKYATILFHGDGDSQVRIDVVKGDTTESILGDEQAIEILAGETIEIRAVNTDSSSPRFAPMIEIASLAW